MGKVEMKKQQAIQRIAEYLLIEGFNQTGLRKLAEVAGTSDRMLIYYFDSKDRLLDVVLGSIADNVTLQLDQLMGSHKRSAESLLKELTIVNMAPAFRPAIQLWFELVGLAVRGKEPYASNANLFAQNWIDWIESHLIDGTRDDAKDLFGHLEGSLMINLITNPNP